MDWVIINGLGYHKWTGLTETVLVISISVCTKSTLLYSFYRNSSGTSRKYLAFLLTVFALSGLHCTVFWTQEAK